MAATLGPAAGGELLEQLGFLLVPGPPVAVGPAYLFIALRRRPTLIHFDPERVDYWEAVDGRGLPATLESSASPQGHASFAWGTIRIVDRLGVSNEFVAFGGDLSVSREDGVTVAVLSSAAPIVARGGHSQTWEPVSREIVGFLAQLRAAAEPGGDLERRLAEHTPTALYAAFVERQLERAEAESRRVGWQPAITDAMRHERSRLQASSPSDWEAGVQLIAALPSSA